MQGNADNEEIFSCPTCRMGLDLRFSPESEEKNILTCKTCKKNFRNKQGVWQFLEVDDYTQSFGFQWQIHAKTQLDQFNGTRCSHERFLSETKWQPQDLKGKRLLEIGSGAGRFTEVVLDYGAKVFSLEPSQAVFVNAKNNKHENLSLIRASLFESPFREESFDFLCCFGVIQHTPDVERAFKSLFPFLKKNGRFCVDVYAAPLSYFHPRHLFRPFTKKMRPEKLYQWVQWWVPKLLPLSTFFHKIPVFGELFARIIPIANWRKNVQLTSEAQYLEWSILDTFDWYSPTYEKPQFAFSLRKWCRDLNLKEFQVERNRGIFVISGIK